MTGSPIVIGHRGASGYRPEHTLAAYELAVRMGADAVEPDLVATRDGVLVARHENEIGGTTDVASHPELAHLRTTKTVDGHRQTGWFTEDLTLAQLRTLRATERLGTLRPTNRLYDGRWSVVTLEEIVAFVRGEARRAGRPVGLVLELKHATHFAAHGLDLVGLLLQTLERVGLAAADPGLPVWVESFETGDLVRLAQRCDLPLVQLVEDGGTPPDRPDLPSAALLAPRGLDVLATYAAGVSVRKSLVLADSGEPTPLVDQAHDRGLACWVYTLRAENTFLPPRLRRGEQAAAHGDLAAEVVAHVEAGVDGIFTDFPDLTVVPVAQLRAGSRATSGSPVGATAEPVLGSATGPAEGTRIHATR